MNLPVKILITALTTLLCILLLLYSVIGIVLLGPSEDASRALLTTLNESGATRFIPRLYMNEQKIEDVLSSYDAGEIIEVKTVVIGANKK